VTEAQVSISPLRESSEILQQVSTAPVEETRNFFGAETWDTAADPLKLIFLANISLADSIYETGELYLARASGGLDQDADINGIMNDEPATVAGQWHAILLGERIRGNNLSTLTEAVYRVIEFDIPLLDDAGIRARLDQLAQGAVLDLDRSGSVDYEDVLAWNRSINPGGFLLDVSALDELAEAIRAGADTTTIRELSYIALGLPPESAGPFTITGSVLVSNSTRVDSDVNDPFAAFVDNSSFETAQPIINPVVLGGYANAPGAGASGSSSLIGDQDDFYIVDLLQGQVITMIMADDPNLNDLDLYLYNDLGELVDASLDLVEVEQITIPADGSYRIAVRVFSGASNYRLTTGLTELPAQSDRLRLSEDFIPGDIIARFREGHRDVDSMAKRARFSGMRVRGGLRRANLLQMRDPTGAGQQRQGKAAKQLKLRTLKALKRLRRSAAVESADLNYRVQAAAVPNDAFYYQQRWHYEMINLPAAWNLSLGDDVIVGVIDTGVMLDHPDLAGQLVAGYDFISSPSIAVDGDGIDPDPDDPGDPGGNSPGSFHGTHVSGTIAAATNNAPAGSSLGRGVAGVAWNAKIMPLRALGPEGGTSYDVLQCVRYAAGLANDSGTLPAQRADVINMSLSGGGFSSSAQALYSQVADLGVVVVAAAGNDSSSQNAYPAAYSDVISVSAVNINKARAYYSNFGTTIDVAAPGGDSFTPDVNGDGNADLVLSTSADDSFFPIRATYAANQGTSMASPHVAGVIALMKSLYPDLDISAVRSLLQAGLLTDDLGATGRDNIFGHGLINANKAVLAAESLSTGGSITNLPSITATPSALNFGDFADVLSLTLTNGGTGELIIDSVTAADTWLAVSPVNVDGNGVGSYNVSVDRSQLAIGSHSSTVAVTSNGGSTEVRVIMQKSDPNALSGGDAGLHYVLLVSADTGEVVQEVMVPATDGEYPYQFVDIPPGNYQVFAGGDADNDFFICDAGEACGGWPVLDPQPAVIQLYEDLSDIDFSTTFNTGILSGSSTTRHSGGKRRSAYTRPSSRD
jgi:serine protease